MNTLYSSPRASLFSLENSSSRYEKLLRRGSAGFTLLETIISLGIFVIFSSGIYLAYSTIIEALTRSKAYSASVFAAQNEAEAIRNMSYENIGVVGGLPSGLLAAEKSVSYGGYSFVVKTTVRNIDDPFDGTIGGSPNDTAPADYKLVEVKVECPGCGNLTPYQLTTAVAPKNLEGATGNGALFINVFDASGQAIAGATVAIVNNALNPAVNFSDTTNSSGVLQLVDVATSTSAYEITVSKNGYSTEKTYPLGGAGNPNPVKPHATVASQQVTTISFAVDRTGTINLKTTDKMCQAVAGIDFEQKGTKLIGTDPDTLKYSATSTTDSNGQKAIGGLEWDTYVFSNKDADYDLSGYSSPLSVALNPEASIDASWIVEPKNPRALLVSVKDGNGAAISDAAVKLEKTGYSRTILSGRRFFSQTDWSGGNYAAQSGKVEADNPAGEIKLQFSGSAYATSTEWLISPTFDVGVASSVFYNLEWQPENQPPETGSDNVRFQVAANNDGNSWNFTGPDGTENTYYDSTSTPIGAALNNSRYFRYKTFLKTANENFTPSINDVSVNFSSSCLPSGQAFFNGLSSGTYTLTVSKSGFQTLTDAAVSVSQNWQEYNAILTPQ
ncbi:MAG: prepilin-type N-terminal cleavage/methylation domain-containing protein [Parcubacteria group bacterium]|nr:prepilin-type N-terminal cleavage/methylation domain-containing protein [Parcubacteria group bacterium]